MSAEGPLPTKADYVVVCDPWQAGKSRLKRVFGLDKAIAYTVVARAASTLGSVGTVLLLVHFLTPTQQGYYYTLLSLVALQTVFELGFSVVILQMAAHERAHLTISADLQVEGDARAHARLASILQKTVHWYAIASVMMLAILLPVGIFFFSKNQTQSTSTEWFWPWCLIVPSCVLAFLSTPICSFLEGCGYVPQVAKMRVWQCLVAVGFGWVALLTHHGLYAPSAVLLMQGLVCFAFFAGYSRLLLSLLRHRAGDNSIVWGTEVWPFQWRIAASSVCVYLSALVFTPIVFALRGSVAAGQFGLSMNITASLVALALPWMTTKAAPFGQLVAKRDWRSLDQIFFHAMRQSTLLFSAFLLACGMGMLWLSYTYPDIAGRMLRPRYFSLLLGASLCNYIVQSEAVYLRAHKQEPFFLQSVLVAALTLLSSVVLARIWGTAGVVWAYFTCAGVIGAATATIIFFRIRQSGSLRHSSAIEFPQPIGGNACK